MRVEIINIGDEVLRAETREDNGRFLASVLTSAGYEPAKITAIADDMESISSEIASSMSRSEVVIVTGGLGPTVDDMTRQAAIEALGGKTEIRGEIVPGIEAAFKRFGREMPEGYRDLGRIPAGAEVLRNPTGAAPGLAVSRDGRQLFLLPGVPAEMKAIFTETVLPRLEREAARKRLTLKIYGMMETEVEDLVRDTLGTSATGDLSVISGPGGIAVHLWEDLLSAEAIDSLRSRFGSYIYTSGDSSMEEEVVRLLLERGKTVATAESLTGGLLASSIISVPGASDSFMEGFVTYSNEAKAKSLGVDMSLIEEFGAVSGQVCVAMAEAARSRAGTDTALSTTGIAGPGGGSIEKPVGLVYVGLSTESGTFFRKMILPGTRQQIRLRTVYRSLDMLRLWLTGENERLESLSS